jgi:hypothetical protein
MAQVKGIFAAIFSIIAWEIWRTKKVDSKATARSAFQASTDRSLSRRFKNYSA